MSVSLEYLQRCSALTGYAIGPLEKVVRLGEIAADISRHPFLGRVLALKGGSALNLCLNQPRRLSVDLDFNYIERSWDVVCPFMKLDDNESKYVASIQHGVLFTESS